MTSPSTIPPAPDITGTPEPEHLSRFQRVADKVSYGMGTPTNIAVWVVLVVGWVLLFALDHSPTVEHGTFMPAWFTSTGFNFPLNLITTVVELYVGFLVGASSNRSERNLEATLARISAQDEAIAAQGVQLRETSVQLSESLDLNTQLTRAIHDLTEAIHATICGAPEETPAPAT